VDRFGFSATREISHLRQVYNCNHLLFFIKLFRNKYILVCGFQLSKLLPLLCFVWIFPLFSVSAGMFSGSSVLNFIIKRAVKALKFKIPAALCPATHTSPFRIYHFCVSAHGTMQRVFTSASADANRITVHVRVVAD